MIETLRLANFRCFAQAVVNFPTEGLLFVGENAQGKTSLLEAICVLVRLHSPRTGRAYQMVKFESEGFGIAGNCWGQQRRVDYQKGNYTLRVEGEERGTQGDYLSDGGLVVWMGNEDRELVVGPAEGRRRYLDFLASQLEPSYRRSLGRYKRALQERNALLRDRRGEGAEMESFTKLLIEHGEEVTAARRRVIAKLVEPVAAAQNAVGAQKEAVALSYRSASGDDFAESLAQAAERERRQGMTLVGPHRDDLQLQLNGLKAADFASEGQQRTLALALKLGQGELLRAEGQRTPVYLLDDIFGELDPGRRERLLESLPQSAQIIATTTNAAWLGDELKIETREVVAGAVL